VRARANDAARDGEKAMKAVLISTTLALAASSAASAETRNLTDFDRVSASGGTRVALSIGTGFSVDVEGRDAAQIVTRVASGRLIIEPVRGWRIRGRREALVRVAMPSLAAIDASSGAEVNASGITAGDMAPKETVRKVFVVFEWEA
jgi:hypothetical protein